MNYYVLFCWLSVANKCLDACAWICGVSFVLAVVFFFLLFGDNTEEETKRYKKNFNIFKVLAVVCFVFVLLVPSRKDTALILVGGAVGNFITQDSSVRQLPSDLTNFLRSQLQEATKEALKDLSSKKVEDMSKEELLEYIKKNKQQ